MGFVGEDCEMKVLVSVLLSAILATVSSSPQFGFFNGFFNMMMRPRPRPQRPRPQNNGEVFLGNSGGGGGCGGGNQPNHNFGGQDFLIFWRLGCTSFTQSAAASFCRANGMPAISIDSSAKEREFLGLVGREGQKYFWTGGNVRRHPLDWTR